MSVSPTEEALIVALDFEGRPNAPYPIVEKTLKFLVQQASTVSSVRHRRTRFSFSLTLPSRIS